jgi:hypothetical protein
MYVESEQTDEYLKRQIATVARRDHLMEVAAVVPADLGEQLGPLADLRDVLVRAIKVIEGMIVAPSERAEALAWPGFKL